ncbi:leucine rich repeat family protein [Anaeramoeba flamelloides]|uniref:Leucine rich repeat family protein n=1 Tax=Anaeramoeba flamelloides TaxID=1746091 RepID=A0ABQ8Z0A9_9EUKA|nr:leucine rich repeat family protein [Anaeramoeba flamelloides]
MKHLSEALKVNQTVTKLNLYANQIGAKGVKYLSEAIKVNQTLTKLDLCWNKIGDYVNKKEIQKILQVFIQSLKINKYIISLKISVGNNINLEEINKISNLIKERNLNFQKMLTKSVKEGNLQLFQQLIQIEKIPLINQSFLRFTIDSSNNQKEEFTIFHTAIFHNQAEISIPFIICK